MIHNKTKALFLGLGLLAGTATTFGIAAYAQTNPTVVTANPTAQSITTKADTDNIQDVDGVEVKDTNVSGASTEIDDDKGDANEVNEQKGDNEKSGSETQDGQDGPDGND